jgi:hypothetical protein
VVAAGVVVLHRVLRGNKRKISRELRQLRKLICVIGAIRG